MTAVRAGMALQVTADAYTGNAERSGAPGRGRAACVLRHGVQEKHGLDLPALEQIRDPTDAEG